MYIAVQLSEGSSQEPTCRVNTPVPFSLSLTHTIPPRTIAASIEHSFRLHFEGCVPQQARGLSTSTPSSSICLCLWPCVRPCLLASKACEVYWTRAEGRRASSHVPRRLSQSAARQPQRSIVAASDQRYISRQIRLASHLYGLQRGHMELL